MRGILGVRSSNRVGTTVSRHSVTGTRVRWTCFTLKLFEPLTALASPYPLLHLIFFVLILKMNATTNLFGRDLSVRVVILLSCLSSVPTTGCKEEDNKLFAPRTRSPLGNNLRTRTLDNKIGRLINQFTLLG
ncbi:GSCOCG00013273001-RA-CDS [Cotesia congregata]|nr:GSCOCG00013273001-RA-CDS [Cotesia congregata]